MSVTLDGLNLHDSGFVSVSIHGPPEADVVVELDYIVSYSSMETRRARLCFKDVAWVELGLNAWIAGAERIREGRTLTRTETVEILLRNKITSSESMPLGAHTIETAVTASRFVVVCRGVVLECVG